MNRSNLNTANINGAVLDPIQRGFVALVGVAQIVANRRALVRGPLVRNPTASVTLIGRALRRAVEWVSPRASVTAIGKGLVHGQITSTPRASITAAGTAQPPDLVFGRANVTPTATATIVARKLRKLFVASSAQAQIQITGDMGYSIVPGAADVQTGAIISVTGTSYAKVLGSVAVVCRAAGQFTGKLFFSNIRAPLTLFARGQVNLAAPTVLKLKFSPVTALARASIALTGRNYYSLIMGTVNGTPRAQIVIDFEVRKQIPYDEDAPIERTMILPEDDRTIVVT